MTYTCEHCGILFAAERYGRVLRYCSRRCGGQACAPRAHAASGRDQTRADVLQARAQLSADASQKEIAQLSGYSEGTVSRHLVSERLESAAQIARAALRGKP